MQRNKALVEEIEQIAKNKACDAAQISLAWLLAQGQDIAMIPGTKRRPYLEKNVQSMAVQLSAAELSTLSELSSKYTVVGAR